MFARVLSVWPNWWRIYSRWPSVVAEVFASFLSARPRWWRIYFKWPSVSGNICSLFVCLAQMVAYQFQTAINFRKRSPACCLAQMVTYPFPMTINFRERLFSRVPVCLKWSRTRSKRPSILGNVFSRVLSGWPKRPIKMTVSFYKHVRSLLVFPA